VLADDTRSCCQSLHCSDRSQYDATAISSAAAAAAAATILDEFLVPVAPSLQLVEIKSSSCTAVTYFDVVDGWSTKTDAFEDATTQFDVRRLLVGTTAAPWSKNDQATNLDPPLVRNSINNPPPRLHLSLSSPSFAWPKVHCDSLP